MSNYKVLILTINNTFSTSNMLDKEELWRSVLAQMQLNISEANFNMCFQNTSITSIKDGQALISAPGEFVKGMLEQKHGKAVFKILRELSPEIKEVCFIAGEQKLKNLKKEVKMTPSSTLAEENQLEFPELKINKETNLNPRYTFENFVVGPFNEVPWAAARATAENPGHIYNPLFIYGGVGLGKTHLLQSIGNEAIKKNPKAKVKYISSEKFTSEVIGALLSNSMEAIKEKYRPADILIIDDVQFLAGKQKVQEELFHTFNHLYERNKQIVLSSDRLPKAIPTLAERLRSRFEGGMMVDVSSPDIETRVAILKHKAQEKGIELPEETLTFIAEKVQKNIRELEGALNKLLIHQKLGSSFSAEDSKNALKKIFMTPTKLTNPKKVIQSVAEFYDIKEKHLLTQSRKREVVKPRQVAMFLLREDLKCSFPFIGQKLGGKDHTTAMHSYDKINREIENNENLKEEIELIRRVISS